MAFTSIQAESVTYTVTSTTTVEVSGTAPTGSSSTYKSTYTKKHQLTAENSMALTLSGFAGYKIKGIKMSMRSNTSTGSGEFSMKAGSTILSSIETAKFNTASWAGKWSTSYIDVTPTISNHDYTIGDENVVITITATENSLYCQSFTIEYEKNTTPEPGITAPSAPTLPASCSFVNSMTVEITNITEGATVYYTTDESEPTTSSTKYSAPFEITDKYDVTTVGAPW